MIDGSPGGEILMNVFNVKVEYDMMPIRHIAVECPKCKKWFKGWQITENDLSEHNDIYNAAFTCPLCGEEFGHIMPLYGGEEWEVNIKESGYPDIYKDCLEKKYTWE